MAWTVEFERRAERELAKLDRAVAARILSFLNQRVAQSDDPRSVGEALRGSRLGDFWKYRIGDYRVIARIEDAKVVVLVLRIGNRREVYR